MKVFEFDLRRFDEVHSEGNIIYGTAGDDNSINNDNSFVIIDAGDGNDSIYNGGNAVGSTIIGGLGNDSIYNEASDVLINAGADDDSIQNNGDNVSIDAGTGNDDIFNNGGKSVTIKGGGGNDNINSWNGSENIRVEDMSGDNTISSDAPNATIKTGAGNDHIFIGDTGSYATIDSGGGSDTVGIFFDNVLINAGDGDDSIQNEGKNSTLDGGSGNDSIQNYGENIFIDAGADNDFIKNIGDTNTIAGGSGNDFVRNDWGVGLLYVYTSGNDTLDYFNVNSTLLIEDDWFSVRNEDEGTVIITITGKGTLTLTNYWYDNINVVASLNQIKHRNIIRNENDDTVVNGTADEDYILNVAGNVSIDADADNDYIDLEGINISVNADSGDDTVHTNNVTNVTINAGAGNDSIYIVGKQVLVDAGTDNDYIWNNWGENTTINCGEGDDTVYNNISKTTINGGDNNDSLRNWGGSNVLMNGNEGNDFFYSYAGSNVIINGGAGSDSIDNNTNDALLAGGLDRDFIDNRGSSATIDGGAGDDYIFNEGSNVSINAGDDNDTIYNGDAENVTIEPGDGNDSVRNQNSSNITIEGGANNDTIENFGGANILIDGGNDNDTLRNFGGESVTVKGGLGDDYIYSDFHDDLIDGGDGNDSISNSGPNVTIDGGDGDDSISNIGSYVTIDGGEGSDTIRILDGGNITIKGGAGNDNIRSGGYNILTDAGSGDDFITEYATNSTITTGLGIDTIAISTYAKNLTITDLTPEDVLDFQTKPQFARFADGVLDMGSIKITLPNVQDIDAYRDMTITWDRSTYMKLGTLLDAPAYVWTVKQVNGTTTAKYGPEGGNVEIVLTGLKGSLTSAEVAQGITVGAWQIELSSSVLGDTDVLLESDLGSHYLTLANDARSEYFNGWSFDENTSSYEYQHKVLTDGYTITDNAKKISALKAGEICNQVVVKGLKKNLTINEDGTIDGIYVETVSDTFGRVFFDDMNLLEDNVTVEGEGRDLIFRDHGDYTGKTLHGTETDNSMYIEGSGASIRSEGGNDFIGVYHSGNTIDTGEGDDEVYVTTSDNFIITGAGEDTVHGQGDNLTIQADAGDDIINVSGFDNIITGGKGNDTVNAGGLEYIFTYALGDGNDQISKGAIINLVDGATISESLTNGNDIVLKFTDGGSITIKDAALNDDNYNFGIVENDDYQDYVGFENATNNQPSRLITLGNKVVRKAKAENYGDNATIIADGTMVSINNMGDEVVIDGKNAERVLLDLDSRNSTIETGDGPDTIRALSNDNDKNTINTGGGPDVVNNNGPGSNVDCGDGPDYYYGCPNSKNTTVKGGNDPDTLEAEGANSKLDGGPDGDVIANGDNHDVGEEIQNQRDKAKEEAKKALIELAKAMREQWADNPTIQDILKNGANSEYLKHLPQNEREAFAEFIQNTWTSLNDVAVVDTTAHDISLASTVVGNFVQAIGEAGELYYKKYGLDHRYLVKKLGDIIDPAYADELILQTSPTIKAIQEAEKQAVKEQLNNLNKNWKYAKTAEKAGKGLKALGKRIKGVGTVIEGGELIGAIWEYETSKNGDNVLSYVQDAAALFPLFPGPVGAYFMGKWIYEGITNGGEKFDNVVCEGIDVATSTIPIPFADMAVAAGARKVYKWGANAVRNELAKADSTRASKSRLMASYRNSSNDIVDIETLEEFYMNDPNTGAVLGGDGNDIMLNNKRDNVWINGGADDDLIKNYNSANVTVNGGDGDDVISNLNSPNTTINAGSGNDFIVSNYSNNVSINTGEGNNSVSVYDSNNVTVTTGNGDNSISNIGKHVTINAGDGNDDIFNIGAHVLINSGSGSNTIESVGDKVTITAGDGNNSIHAEGNNVVMTVGSGSNIIDTNEFYYGLIQTGDGADDIINIGNSSTIDAGGGSNSITNIGNSNKIFGSVGDDYAGSFGDSNTLSTGDDDDLIELGGNSNSIDASEGNDLILIYSGTDNTINAGKGDDLLYLGSSVAVLINYDIGNGNDSILGFNETSKLSIAGDSYFTQTVDDDVIVTVGDGLITLIDAASLQAININEEIITNSKWTLEGKTATYGTPEEILITLNGVKSTDGILIDGKTVTLTQAALGNDDVTISDGYTLALSGVFEPKTTDAHFSGLTFKSASNSEGYSLSGDKKSVTYTPAVAEKDLFSLLPILSASIQRRRLLLSLPTISSARMFPLPAIIRWLSAASILHLQRRLTSVA